MFLLLFFESVDFHKRLISIKRIVMHKSGGIFLYCDWLMLWKNPVGYYHGRLCEHRSSECRCRGLTCVCVLKCYVSVTFFEAVGFHKRLFSIKRIVMYRQDFFLLRLVNTQAEKVGFVQLFLLIHTILNKHLLSACKCN